jgi:hypothetical protein
MNPALTYAFQSLLEACLASLTKNEKRKTKNGIIRCTAGR